MRIRRTFPQCDKKCIAQQLKDHYKKKLKHCKVAAVNKQGKPITPKPQDVDIKG